MAWASADEAIAALFQEHGRSLVRLARLFADDRNAAEDLVQEAFIRLGRASHRIQDPSKAAAYLRSIVLNLAEGAGKHSKLDERRYLRDVERGSNGVSGAAGCLRAARAVYPACAG